MMISYIYTIILRGMCEENSPTLFFKFDFPGVQELRWARAALYQLKYFQVERGGGGRFHLGAYKSLPKLHQFQTFFLLSFHFFLLPNWINFDWIFLPCLYILNSADMISSSSLSGSSFVSNQKSWVHCKVYSRSNYYVMESIIIPFADVVRIIPAAPLGDLCSQSS